jgi:2'-5' RNA ligase
MKTVCFHTSARQLGTRECVYHVVGMRLFVAVPLATPVVHELSATSARLRSGEDGLRWSAPESWHITLQFLGNANQDQYDCIVERLSELHLPVVRIRIAGLGFFDRAGVFFADVKPTPELLLLQKRVAKATEVCGFIPEMRPYRPHVTLARRKGRGAGREFTHLKARASGQPTFTNFVAEEFLLYESLPGPAGSHHEIRERFRLRDRSMGRREE